jgi:hypothetical protein
VVTGFRLNSCGSKAAAGIGSPLFMTLPWV